MTTGCRFAARFLSAGYVLVWGGFAGRDRRTDGAIVEALVGSVVCVCISSVPGGVEALPVGLLF